VVRETHIFLLKEKDKGNYNVCEHRPQRGAIIKNNAKTRGDHRKKKIGVSKEYRGLLTLGGARMEWAYKLFGKKISYAKEGVILIFRSLSR